jgi:hypothetical protein
MSFLVVLTRALNEPHLATFVDYYRAEGADRVIICADRWTRHADVLARVAQRADVQVLPMVQRRLRSPAECVAHAYRTHVVGRYRWCLSVDVDEFVLPRGPLTLAEALRQRYDDVDHVSIPWLLMGFNGRQHEPRDLLCDNVWRLDHDRPRRPLPHKELDPGHAYDKHKDGYFLSLPKSVVNPSVCTRWDEHSPYADGRFVAREAVLGLTTVCRGPHFCPWWMHRPNSPLGLLRRAFGIDRTRLQWGVPSRALDAYRHAPPWHDGRCGYLSEAALAQAAMVTCHYRFTSGDAVRDKVGDSRAQSRDAVGFAEREKRYHARLTVADVDPSEMRDLRMCHRRTWHNIRLQHKE